MIGIMKELIVLVDKDGQAIGTAEKLPAHTADTKLHLAFSCFLFDEKGRYLLTRRALTKKVWPGWWTVSFCGHLSPGETAIDALKRRAKFELGLAKLKNISLILPDYRYTTPPYNGIIENEICPVYAAIVDSPIRPNPDEVKEYRWVEWPKVMKMVEDEPEKYSWWMKDEINKLKRSSQFEDFLKQFK